MVEPESRRKWWRWASGIVAALVVLGVMVMYVPAFNRVKVRLIGRHTIEQRVEQFGDAVWTRLGIRGNPTAMILVVYKDVRQLELFVADGGTGVRFVRRYPVLGMSGGLGPKLRAGDRQVPEGIYQITDLNPNSAFHVAMRVGYPNADDQAQAARDGRSDLGGDIMIHGSNVSIGCLAMGDEAAEDLFVLAARGGLAHVSLFIVPTDLRKNPNFSLSPAQPAWITNRYADLRQALTVALPPEKNEAVAPER